MTISRNRKKGTLGLTLKKALISSLPAIASAIVPVMITTIASFFKSKID